MGWRLTNIISDRREPADEKQFERIHFYVYLVFVFATCMICGFQPQTMKKQTINNTIVARRHRSTKIQTAIEKKIISSISHSSTRRSSSRSNVSEEEEFDKAYEHVEAEDDGARQEDGVSDPLALSKEERETIVTEIYTSYAY